MDTRVTWIFCLLLQKCTCIWVERKYEMPKIIFFQVL